MSRSFTVKPSVAYSQGRGRGAPTNQPSVGRGRARGGTTVRTQTDRLATRSTQADMDKDQGQLGDGTVGRQPGGAGAGMEQRMSHQGAFTMITPNERKRQQVAEQARREEEAYQRHKENNRLGHVSYVGTVGGAQKTENEARHQQAQTHKSSKFDSIQKRQAARDAVKRRDEEEISKMKAEQRRKAQQNTRSEAERQQRLQEDHRTKNEAFLKRIEAEQKSKSRSKYSQPSASTVPVVETEKREAASSGDTLHNNGDPPFVNTVGNLSLGNTYDDPSLRELQRMFPSYDQDTLRDILLQAGSVEDAASLLS
ncbi:epithelial-stromal interaction protein 1-like [Saccostrea echinata]|uniref:epithelial-stromal interaction protein 1-like n=1 Tax=Saccostrea echinata TaxID=191078 RepID=UPI002A83B7B6|nr:epithelial-stromal interaction protein 1-like [Saccostrea echinata]